MNYLKSIVYITTAFVDAYLAYTISSSILYRNGRKHPWIGSFLLFPILILTLNVLVENVNFRVAITVSFTILCAIVWFDGNILVKVFSGALFACVLFVGDIFTYGIVLGFFPDYLDAPSDQIFLFGSVSFYIFIAVFIVIIRRFPLKAMGTLSKRQGLFLVCMPTVGAAVITLLINFLKVNGIYNSAVFILPALFFVLLMIFVVFSFEMMVAIANQARTQTQLNYQIENITTRYESLEAAYASLSGLKHDWKNHLFVLDSLLKNEKWSEVAAYVNDSHDILDGNMIPASTNNPTLNVLLGSLSMRAKKHDIKLELDISILPEITIRRADLCIILGNAFDNAIEATQGASVERRWIKVKLSAKKEPYLYVSVENAFSALPKKKEDRYISNKADNEFHGLGIRNMEAVARKYNGFLSLTNTDEIFMLRCMLMNTDST